MDGTKQMPRLMGNYPNAYTDFYGSDTPCVLKTGPEWYKRTGPEAYGIFREARPIYRHPIAPTWLSIGKTIIQSLDSVGVRWTSINPLAYANAGEAKPFCPFIISIGVKPYSLLYNTAVVAAKVIKRILTGAGFPTIEVAFVESVVTRSVAAGPKLLSFDPLFDEVPELRKPFTPALGLSIAPLQYPHFEGTGALYYRLGQNDDRIALLTCAHVARPTPVYPNTRMTLKENTGQAREEIVVLGNRGYNDAIKAVMRKTGGLIRSIDVWNGVLKRLGNPVEGENTMITERRKEHVNLIWRATKRIKEANTLHEEVTKHRTTTDQRVVGFVLHSEEIKVSVEPHNFTEDWALVELYGEKIDWKSFKGNKVFIRGNMSIPDFVKTMFPQPADRANYDYPVDSLLQAYGVVQDAEFRDPQHLDVHNEKCLLVVKNGPVTGTTVGRANGLESFTRHYDDYGTHCDSIQIAVIGYDKQHRKFSDGGDSGSIVLARDGRIVGLLTGGAGPTDETVISYITPYWWLEQKIKAKFPDCSLYEVVE